MITLVCGLPSSGKTTYSQQFSNVIHRDEYPDTFCDLVAKAEGDVVAEGVYNTQKIRERFLKVIATKKVKKVCIWIDTPMEICLEREKKGRKRGDFLIMNAARQFESPSYDEGWDEIWVVQNNKKIIQERLK